MGTDLRCGFHRSLQSWFVRCAVDKDAEEDRLRKEMALELYGRGEGAGSEEGDFSSGSDLSAWSGSEGGSEEGGGGEGDEVLEVSPRSGAPGRVLALLLVLDLPPFHGSTVRTSIALYALRQQRRFL